MLRYTRHCTLVAILFILLTINFPTSTPQPNNLHVNLVIDDANTLTLKNSQYLHDGNIIIKEFGTLMLSRAELSILQDYDSQYEIILTDNSRIIIYDGKLLSKPVESGSHPPSLNIKLYNYARLEITNSSIGVGISIKAYDSATIIGKDSLIFSNIELRNSAVATLTNSTPLSISAFDDAVAYIYRLLKIRSFDCVGIPVGYTNIDIRHYLNESLYIQTITDSKGETTIPVLSDVVKRITYPSAQFSGNYRIRASYRADGIYRTTEKSIVLPHHENYTVDELGSVNNDACIDVIFTDTLIPPSPYYSTKDEISLGGDMTLTVENRSYSVDGNIKVKDSATLTFKNVDLRISQERDVRYFIEVKNQGKLIFENSKLYSNYPLLLYLYDSAQLSIKDSTLSLANLCSRGDTELIIEESNISGSLNLVAKNVKLVSTNVVSKTLSISSRLIEAINTTFNQPLEFRGNVTAYLTNTTTPAINVYDSSIVYRYWWLGVTTYDYAKRRVDDVKVDVYYFDKLNKILYKSAITDGTKHGRAEFQVLSKIITSERELFVGDYEVLATATNGRNNNNGNNHRQLQQTIYSISIENNTEVELTFPKLLVPPFNIRVTAELSPPVSMRGGIVNVSGIVTFNGGPERVGNATVIIKIVENGKTWTTTTNGNGTFYQLIKAPNKKGKYTILITAYADTYFNGTTDLELVVDGVREMGVWYEELIGMYPPLIVILLGCAVTIIYLYLKRREKFITIEESY